MSIYKYIQENDIFLVKGLLEDPKKVTVITNHVSIRTIVIEYTKYYFFFIPKKIVVFYQYKYLPELLSEDKKYVKVLKMRKELDEHAKEKYV